MPSATHVLTRISFWSSYRVDVFSDRRHPRTRLPYSEDTGAQVKPAVSHADDQPHDASSSTISLPNAVVTGVADPAAGQRPASLDLNSGLSCPPADAPAASIACGVEPVSSPTSNATEAGAVPAVVPSPVPTRAYDARFAYSAVCVCAEEQLVQDAVQQLVGAVRETAAVLTLLHSKDPIARQCAVLARLFEFDGFLW